ncbi:MAG: FtsH protease activity modulator HflK [Phycisphaerae bacterium]|jgi:membrane protease subunit HflK
MMHAQASQPSLPARSDQPRRALRAASAAVLLLALAAYLASGFYFVQPDERGVVRWFGRVPDAQRVPPFGVGPGMHYALPWPFCSVNRPKTTEIRRLFVGLTPETREAIGRGEMWALQSSPASDVLTGDVNILKVTMAVQYQVFDPFAYLFAADGPEQLIRLTVQSVLIERMAALPVDQALTAAKTALEIETLSRSQKLLDEYGSGVRLVATNLQSIEPPEAIAAAFNDVVSAKKDGERAVDRAVAEQNRVIPRARGDAAQRLAEAQGYAQQRVSRARGESDRFLSLLAEYRRSPQLMKDRLRIQSLEKAVSRIRVYLLDNRPGEPPAKLRIIDRADQE